MISRQLYSGVQRFHDLVIPTMQQLFPMFFMIKERPCIDITASELQAFEEYSFLWSKVKLKDNPYRGDYAGLLLALFYEIYDIYQGIPLRSALRKPQGRFV